MSKNKDAMAKLASLRKEAAESDPHEKAANVAEQARKPAATGRGERTAVNLTPGAVDALKQIQAFLITECGAKSASASAAICVALESTAETLNKRKDEIDGLYQERQKADGRRKTT